MGAPQQGINLNTKAKDQQTYDAIVIGSGISGGWAAKELCEKGLNTLVLERGRNVEHVKDYTTAFMNPWDFEHGLRVTEKDKAENPIQSQVFGYNEGNKQFFVNDKEHPYVQGRGAFSWIRGYQVGGRSLTWGRMCYRWSDLDFEANGKEGIGVDWPIRYKDISPWYDYVEDFTGVSGQPEGLPQLPDGVMLPPMEMNFLEKHFREQVKKHFPERCVTIGRMANLSRGWKGRGPCQYRNLCSRGCPFGGYFSSNSATLPAALATGNLTLRPFAIVAEILYDKDKKRATGVRIIDAVTHESREFYAKIIFLNASTIGSTSILLQSKSAEFPDGLGNTNGLMGKFLIDHHQRVGAEGVYHGFMDEYYSGRRPASLYIPRFRNINAATARTDYVRGFGYQGSAIREGWNEQSATLQGFGADFKNQLTSPGPWSMSLDAFGETLPYAENKVSLSADKKDRWGLPQVEIDFSFQSNEKHMRKDIKHSAAEMLSAAGCTEINEFDYNSPGGAGIHEMGGLRMGLDPKTSLLNSRNQLHSAHNLFVTDGSCMASSACQNPSLTYMALTARACDFAVSELKKGNLG